MDWLEIIKLLIPVISLLTGALGAWVTLKVTMATQELRIKTLEEEIDKQGDWQVKLIDVLHGIEVTLGRMDERMKGVEEKLKEGK